MTPMGRELTRHGLCVLAYVAATFLVQGSAHFFLFATHYASVQILRAEPRFELGLSSMVIQGSVLSFILVSSRFNSGRIFDAVRLSWCFGGFLVSYIALAEAGKYNIADVPSWIATEATTAFIQYTLVGIAFGLIHRRPLQRAGAAAA